jgi:hypothetical protein
MIFVSKERYGRASRRFKGVVGNIGELEGNLEKLGQTMYLPWVCHVRPCFRLVAKLLPNSFLLLKKC